METYGKKGKTILPLIVVFLILVAITLVILLTQARTVFFPSSGSEQSDSLELEDEALLEDRQPEIPEE